MLLEAMYFLGQSCLSKARQDEEEKKGVLPQPALLLQFVAWPGLGMAQGSTLLLGNSLQQLP